MTHDEGESRVYYDDFSGWYERERRRGYHAMLDDLEVSVAAPFARDARICEAGCGTGLILSRLAPLARRAVGFDLSPGMARRAHERGLQVVLGSVTAPPFADESFDLVYSFKVLAHVPDIRAAIAALARTVVHGGTLLLEFYNPWSLRFVAKRLGGPGAISQARTEADVYTRWDSPRGVRALLPPGLDLRAFHGVRIWTPFAAAHEVPVVGRALAKLERLSVDSPLAVFGGFLVADIAKR